ncbi:PepSY domain-containing protein [Sphingomonas immobilis]|uniref:PepSY domain-containing protein n=1 Tax=Sphingomonas immobilis TaxID=3063997 RepID=A0ABT9A1L9_9SPHN|nr:PepSY domain-containing protein [Sphingomonas sp. CA1-15]MDO7842901.1 PepSY domain-containing protein [Sphingomonas sp. CA1-15]
MLSLTIATVLVASCPAAATPARPTPKIAPAAARAIALKRAPGQVKAAEYEYEKGGWRYSFDIAQGGRIHEIGADAMSGKVVEDMYETPGAKD